jgi:hypothetical protein
MKSQTYSLVLPPELLGEVRQMAKETGLSVADAIRQSMRIGLPQLREKLSRTLTLKPFTAAEAREAFAPDTEWDPFTAAMARVPMKPEASPTNSIDLG